MTTEAISSVMPTPSDVAARRGLARIPLVVRMLFYGMFFLAVVLLGIAGLNYQIDRIWPACHIEVGAWRWVGAALFAASLSVYVCTAVLLSRLGEGAFAEFDPPSRFVRVGPYRWVRNPISLCVLAMILGEALALSSTGIFLMLFVSMVIAHLQATHLEEPLLLRRFGQSYADYRTEVPRWIPRRPKLS
jgi:protein-S-isoprenylcysteine O-methyltransferase Ste14